MNLAIIELVISVILKAIPFIETLMSGSAGADKKAAVVAIAKGVVGGASQLVVANNPTWTFLEPMVNGFIDNAVTASNAIEAASKAQGSPAKGSEV